jgi:hypothetical protein
MRSPEENVSCLPELAKSDNPPPLALKLGINFGSGLATTRRRFKSTAALSKFNVCEFDAGLSNILGNGLTYV